MNLLERLTAVGPKRILALDGGGIRGATFRSRWLHMRFTIHGLAQTGEFGANCLNYDGESKT